MADKKISELVLLDAISGSAIIPAVAGNSTYAVLIEDIATYSNQWSAKTGSNNTFTGTNTFSATNTFDGAVFLNGDVAVAGLISAPTLNRIYQSTSSLNIFTGSIVSEIGGIEAYTQSLKALPIISGAQQLIDLGFTNASDIVSSSAQILAFGFLQTASFNEYTSALNASTESLVSYNVLSQSFSNFTSSAVSIFGNLTIVSSSLFINSTGNYIRKKSDISAPDLEIRADDDGVGISLTSNNRTWRIEPDSGTLQASIYEIENNDGIRVFDSINGLHSFSSSVDAHILGISQQTASQDLVNLGISTFTGSLREEVNGIEAYTASLKGAIEVSGQNVNVLGMITAQQFNVTYVSSSVQYQSGSTKFGDTSDDRHEFTGSVEVTGAITASVVSSSYMKFDSLPNGTAPSYQEGLLYYDNDMGALTFYNNEADIALQIGQEEYIRVINKSGDAILNGTPVRVSGSQGDMVKIYKAEAFIHTGSYSDSEANNHILGLATHDILDDETGYVTISGLVKGINTDTYEAGDVLYVQTGSAGVLTNLEPKFPYDKIQVGIVGRKHPSVGEVLVLPKEPTHFGNITGLSGSATTEVGDLWVYKSNNAWATSKVLEGNYTFVGEQEFSGSLIPNVGVGEYTSSFSLGSATNAWKDLWVGEGSVNFVNASTGNTASISLGEDDVISVQEFRTSGSLQIGGNLVVTGSVYMYPGSGGVTSSLEGTASYALSGAPNLATTGSNIFVGNQTLSGSVIPSQTPSQFTSSYSLGSEDNLWKKLWVGDISASGITYLSKTPGGIGTTGTLNIESGPGYEIVFKGSTSAVNILNEGLTPMYMGNVSYPTLFKMYNDVFTVGGTAQISEQLQITGSTIAVGGVTGSLEGTASYAITASYALNGGGGGGGIFTELAPSLYTTNNSLEVTGSLNVGGAITASLQEGYMWVGTPNGISTQIPTASMFTSSYILPDNLTGSVYVSSSFSGPGTLTLTKGDSSLDILTLGSSYVVSTIPENEIILSPTRSYNGLNAALADGAAATFANAANEFDFAFNGSKLYFIDDTNSQWADVGLGDYIKFNAEGSNVAGAYYSVGSAPYNVSAGSPAKNVWGFGSLTPVDSNNTFTGGGSASFQASISVPYSAYNPSNGTATYGSRYWELTSFGSSPGLAYTIQANVSSSYWLRLGTATGGTTHLDTGGYVGLSSDNSNWTYYIVTDEVYTDNVGGNDYIYHKIEPVDGAYAASNGSTAYVKGLKSIPAYPYNRTLSNLKYAQTIPSTSSTTGSASDISYDTDNLYVKTSEGWKAAPLGEFSSPTAVTSSVSYITGSVTIDRILKLDSNWTGGMPAGQAGQIIASSSYGFTNLYVHDGTEWKWLTTGSIE